MKKMKKKLVIIAIALMSIVSINVANATVRTVSNNQNSPGQYTNLQTAVSVCNSGDTVYVAPSATSYGNLGFTLTPNISIIGGGYNNPGTQDNLGTIIDNLYVGNGSNSTGWL